MSSVGWRLDGQVWLLGSCGVMYIVGYTGHNQGREGVTRMVMYYPARDVHGTRRAEGCRENGNDVLIQRGVG